MSSSGTSLKERAAELFTESVSDNPVVVRELRTRMRGWKAFAIMGGYVLAMGIVLAVTFAYVVDEFRYRSHAMSDLGMYLFSVLNWSQAVLLALIIPSLTYSAITTEIEKKTIEMLALTRLSGGRVVLGKQLAAFGYTLMLLVSSAPMAAICLLFGGISPAEIAVTYVSLVIWSFMLCAACVLWSTLFTRTSNAAVFAYGTSTVYMLATTVLIGEVNYSSDNFVFSHINPGWVPGLALEHALVLGMKIPLIVPAAVVMAGAACLLLLLASTHVQHIRVERALSIRLVLLGLSAVVIALLWGHLGGARGPAAYTPSDLQAMNAAAAGTILVLLCLAAAAIATGPLRKSPDQQAADYALSGWNMFRGDLGGAAGFMCLWWMVCYCSLALVLLVAVRQLSGSIPPDFLMACIGMGMTGMAVVFAVSCSGVLVSAMVRQRQGAYALVLVFNVFVFLGFPILMMMRSQGRVSDSPLWQIAALWPLTPMVQAAGGWREPFWPNLWWARDVSWLVVTCTYVLIAILCLALANSAARKFPGVQEE